jgi:hypothetical protein
MFFFSAPTCFVHLGPSSESIHQNLAKVTKITVVLKYQLKYLVKIVVVWCIKISACGVCSGCCVACDATEHPLHTPQAEIFIRHTTAIFNEVF